MILRWDSELTMYGLWRIWKCLFCREFRWETFKANESGKPKWLQFLVSRSLFLANNWTTTLSSEEKSSEIVQLIHSHSPKIVISMTLKEQRSFSLRTKELNKVEKLRRETVPFCPFTFTNRKSKTQDHLLIRWSVMISFHITVTYMYSTWGRGRHDFWDEDWDFRWVLGLMEVNLSLRCYFVSYSATALRSTICKTSMNGLLLFAVVFYTKFVIVVRKKGEKTLGNNWQGGFIFL
jgi:hypothetical protein